MQNNNAIVIILIDFQDIENVVKNLLQQLQRSWQNQKKLIIFWYFCDWIFNLKIVKNSRINYSNLIQITRNVLVYSIRSVNIKRIFNIVKRVCQFNRA